MTKSELRKARKLAREQGHKLEGELALPRDDVEDRMIFSESTRGYRARDRWARLYDSLNGRPESDDDR